MRRSKTVVLGCSLVTFLSGLFVREGWQLTRDIADVHKASIHRESCPHPLVNTDKCAPRVFIVGAMKCGTNDLMKILALHPRATFNTCNPRTENFCDPETHQGAYHNHTGRYNIWESQHLPVTDSLSAIANRLPVTDGIHHITFDKTPRYMETHILPDVALQLRHMMPGTKIVFAVCDPAERLYAEFHHLRSKGVEYLSPSIQTPATFGEFFHTLTRVCDDDSECLRTANQYLKKGSYVEHIEKWMEVYPRSELLVVDMNEPQKAEKLLRFANLSTVEFPWDSDAYQEHAFRNEEYSGRETAWMENPQEMQALSNYYSDSSKRLAYLLNMSSPLEWRSTVME